MNTFAMVVLQNFVEAGKPEAASKNYTAVDVTMWVGSGSRNTILGRGFFYNAEKKFYEDGIYNVVMAVCRRPFLSSRVDDSPSLFIFTLSSTCTAR
jgi:hypothetical protein